MATACDENDDDGHVMGLVYDEDDHDNDLDINGRATAAGNRMSTQRW
jgi:carotenoid cleavage dioxygenase-like enzyme